MDYRQATVHPYRYEFKTPIDSDRAPGFSGDTLRFFADNVTSGHEATTSAPDESLCFYLRAYGLSEKSKKEAKVL